MAVNTKPVVDEIGRTLIAQGRTLGVAESLTGGQLAAAFAEGDDASTWFRGGVVAYATAVKHDLLGVPDVPAVSEECARALATGAARALDADVTVAVTGVGGPDRQDGQPPGTVWLATFDAGEVESALLHADGEPATVCRQAVLSAVAAVRDRMSREGRKPTQTGMLRSGTMEKRGS